MVTSTLSDEEYASQVKARVYEHVELKNFVGYGIGNGWAALVDLINEELERYDPDYRCVQVKEKFGELRFYWEPSDKLRGRLTSSDIRALSELIDRVAGWSSEICEACGREGTIGGGGWIKTLCDDCRVSGVRP